MKRFLVELRESFLMALHAIASLTPASSFDESARSEAERDNARTALRVLCTARSRAPPA